VLAVRNLNLGIPALLLIVFATWTTNDKNLYSGGLALTNLFPSVARWKHTLLLGTLGTVIGCFRVTRVFTGWLIALGIVFAPLVGVNLAHYFIVERRRPKVEDAYRTDGIYRYTGGVNVAALVAIACGVIAGRLAPRALIEPLVSLVVTMCAYVAAARLLYPERFALGRVGPRGVPESTAPPGAPGVPLS
jgi:purine-cytosine permease-like protein